MAGRLKTKMKIMVTSPEQEDTVLVAAEGDNSRLSTKESFGKISLSAGLEEGSSSIKASAFSSAKPTKKPPESSDSFSIVRFPKQRIDKVEVSGETASNSETSDVEDVMMNWKLDDNVSEMVVVQKQLGLKSSKFRSLFATEENSESELSEISMDGDEVIPAEMLQTWENDSTFSQSEDETDA